MIDSALAFWKRLHSPDTNRRRLPGQPRQDKDKTECLIDKAIRSVRSDILKGSGEARKIVAAMMIQSCWRGYQARCVVKEKIRLEMAKSRVRKRKTSKAMAHMRDFISAPEEQIINEVGVYNSDLVGLAIIKGSDPKLLKNVTWAPEGDVAELWVPLRGSGPTTQIRVRLEYRMFKTKEDEVAEVTTMNGDPLPKEGEVSDVQSEAVLAQLASMREPSPRLDGVKKGTLLVDVLSASDLVNKRAGVLFYRLRPFVQLRVGARVRRTAAGKGVNPRFRLGNRELFTGLCPEDADTRFLEVSVWAAYQPKCVTNVLDQHLFLGMNRIALDEVVRAHNLDVTLRLEGVESGSIKLKLSWLELVR